MTPNKTVKQGGPRAAHPWQNVWAAPRAPPAGGRYRWPVAVIRPPRGMDRAPQPVEISRGPMAEGSGHRAADRDRSTGDRGPDRWTGGRHRRGRKTGQGPPDIGSKGEDQTPKTARRDPRPRADVTGARAMFLANNYIKFRIVFNCYIFAVKIAYITCYVSRETSRKTAYEKLARDPYECSIESCFRREKIEA